MSTNATHRRPGRPSRIWLALLIAAVLVGGVAVRLLVRPGSTSSTAQPSDSPSGLETSAASTPSPTASAISSSPSSGRGKLVIHGAGDVSLDPGFVPNFVTHGYA